VFSTVVADIHNEQTEAYAKATWEEAEWILDLTRSCTSICIMYEVPWEAPRVHKMCS